MRSWRCISPSSSEPALAGALRENWSAGLSIGWGVDLPSTLVSLLFPLDGLSHSRLFPMLLPKNPPKVYGFIISK